MNISEKIDRLRALLNKANHEYYVLNQPEIQDSEYDQYLQELIELENANPEFYDPNSPSMRIGADLVNEFSERLHVRPMLSLANTYSESDLRDFDRRIRQLLAPNTSYSYVAELKIDGLAMSIIYENGQFKYGLTRGDGTKGNDISQNLRTIKSIPLVIENKKKSFEVRGEVFMTKSGFEKFNVERINREEQPFANPRNAAAGSVKILDSRIVAERPLDALWYYIDSDSHLPENHIDRLGLLKEMGFSK